MPGRFSFLILLSLTVLVDCRQAIDFKGGGYSQNAFNFINSVYYPSLDDPKAVADKIVDLEVKGNLARRMGIRSDKKYDIYIRQNFQARMMDALSYFGRTKIGEDYSPEKIWQHLKIKFDFNRIVTTVLNKRREAKKIFNVEDALTEVVGDYNGRSIHLLELKELTNRGDWQQSISGGAQKIAAGMRNSAILWTARRIHEILLADFGTSRRELRKLDHNKVSELYVMARYRLAHKGIYPVKPMELPLTPPELFDYFKKVKHEFKVIDWVAYRLVIVDDIDVAIEFMKRRKAGEDFQKLSLELTTKGKYYQPLTLRKAPGLTDLENENTSEGEGKVPAYDVLAVGYAKRLLVNEPQLYETVFGAAIFELEEIKYIQDNLDYKKYRSVLKIRLTEKLLHEQYTVDYDLTKKKLAPKFHLENTLPKS